MYKLMKIKDTTHVGNYCCRVDYEYVGEFDTFDEDIIIQYAKENNLKGNDYIIEDVTDENNITTSDMLFYYEDEPSFDCAENDFKVMSYVAHHPVSDDMIWKRIREVCERNNITDKVIDFINNKTI